jgi:hypothetical protein
VLHHCYIIVEELELYIGCLKGPPKEEEGTHKSLYFYMMLSIKIISIDNNFLSLFLTFICISCMLCVVIFFLLFYFFFTSSLVH